MAAECKQGSSTNKITILPAFSSLSKLQSNDGDENTLSIVSYNTLYKDWVNKERYPFIKDDKLRTWKYRLPRIRDTIEKFNADIVCLQEIDIDPVTFKQDFGDYFKSKCNYDYRLGPCSKMKAKHKKRESDGHWGNAVLFNKKRYKVVTMDCLKKSARELLLLFTDLKEQRLCTKCHNVDSNASICCIYHSFFVINLHLPGHPAKWRSRLNAIQRVINKLKMYGRNHKSRKIEKKTININTNINGNWKNMRIIICGDFNAPKTGNIDNLLINKCIDVNNYNITRNIYEDVGEVWGTKTEKKEEKQNDDNQISNKKVIRFLCDTKAVGALIGEQGANIKQMRESSKAGIWIFEACRGKYGLMGQSIISLKGTAEIIVNAINLCIDKLKKNLDRTSNGQTRHFQNRLTLKMLIESVNIEMYEITKGIGDASKVLLKVYPKPLPYSTERMIEIEPISKRMDGVDALKLAIKMIVDRWFNDDRCIDTTQIYESQIEADANFDHGYAFKDSYHQGLIQMFETDNDGNDNNDKLHSYYDRMKYLPTYGDGTSLGSMDYIYYTANNMELKGITKSMDNESYGDLKRKIEIECDEIRKKLKDTEDDKNKQQGVLSKVLELPNEVLVSDHLPVAAVFKLPNICGDNKEKCDCMLGVTGRLRGKINKNKSNKKKKKKRDDTNINIKSYNSNGYGHFHHIHSF